MLTNIRFYAVRIVLALVLSIAHIFLCVFEAQAAKSVDITITAQPSAMFAPTDFDAVTITDNKITLTWTPNIFAATTMVRAKTGSYPTGTADGYLVYNGAGNTADDLTVSLDETATNIFYRAWSVDGVGNFSPNYAEDNTGGIGMTMIAFLGAALIMTWIALRNKSTWIMSTFSSAVWAFFFAYWTQGGGRPSGITAGSPADQILVYTLLGIIIIMFVLPLFVEDDKTKALRFKMPFRSDEEEAVIRSSRRQSTSAERRAAYRERANNAVRGIRG